MAQELPTVTVIVLNWNGRALLADCFDALLALDYPLDRLTLLLVDNGSTDESTVYLREHYPQVKLVVIAAQANPFERFLEPNQGYTISGYGDFIDKLRAFVAANPDKHVLYIGGDTHTPRVDHPRRRGRPPSTGGAPRPRRRRRTAPSATACSRPGGP